VEELRQQLRHSHETEASLAKMHVELQAKTLHALEDDKKTDSGEVSCSTHMSSSPKVGSRASGTGDGEALETRLKGGGEPLWLKACTKIEKIFVFQHLQCQKESQKLSEQLSLLKEENKALYEEGVRLLNQKDLYVR